MPGNFIWILIHRGKKFRQLRVFLLTPIRYWACRIVFPFLHCEFQMKEKQTNEDH